LPIGRAVSSIHETQWRL